MVHRCMADPRMVDPCYPPIVATADPCMVDPCTADPCYPLYPPIVAMVDPCTVDPCFGECAARQTGIASHSALAIPHPHSTGMTSLNSGTPPRTVIELTAGQWHEVTKR